MSDNAISDSHEPQSHHFPDILQQLQSRRKANIDIADCRVTFTATQPLKNDSNVFQWEATLNHYYYTNHYGQRNQATLAKASFCFFYRNELLKNEEMSCLYDMVESSAEYVSSILYLESIQVMDVFQGFDYELCLIQRIIDNHARDADMIVIKYDDSVAHICEEMEFEQMKQTLYYSRHQAFGQPRMQNFCKCFDKKAAKQRISDTILANHYVHDDDEEEEKARNDTNHNMNEVDVNECVVTFSSEQNAMNDGVDEDFATLWSAKLQYQSRVLAAASFWFVGLTRLFGMGYHDSIFTVFDAQCQELCDLLAVVNIDIEKVILEWYETIRSRDEMNECGGANIVYLDRVEVHKDYKGHGYGRGLTQIIIDNFARDFDGVVVKPFPLQWETNSRTEQSELTEEEEKELFEKDKKKVIEVWESMWFYQFGGPNSEYWG
eukprot:456164_1